MGEEVSGYIGRLVPALQTAYGEAWNIEARVSVHAFVVHQFADYPVVEIPVFLG